MSFGEFCFMALVLLAALAAYWSGTVAWDNGRKGSAWAWFAVGFFWTLYLFAQDWPHVTDVVQ